MNVLFAAVECFPFAKVGGLGDVIGSLPKELNKLGADTRVIMPRYSCIKESLVEDLELDSEFDCYLYQDKHHIKIYKETYNGVIYYFIDCPEFYANGTVYDGSNDFNRWAFFQNAVCESIAHLKDFKADILNAHDWHTGMIPQIIKVKYQKAYPKLKTVYTIHNVLYQGVYDRSLAQAFGINYDGAMEHDGMMNFMKSAIMNADYVNTVSETYAVELLTNSYFQMGIGYAFNYRKRENRFSGILNGLDYTLFNPWTDKTLSKRYSFYNYKNGKKAAKIKLYESLGVDFDTEVPMMAMVTRLTSQKGLDLVREVIEKFLNEYNVKLVIIGSGEKQYEDFFRCLENRYNSKVKCFLGYSDTMAHLTYAASDIFLMPSAFEPCGLSQIIALKYGSLPLVRETGGLKDTVDPYNEYAMTGNGFSFTDYNANDMLYVMRYCMNTYYNDKEAWDMLVKNAMKCDYSWKISAKKYLNLYKELTK